MPQPAPSFHVHPQARPELAEDWLALLHAGRARTWDLVAPIAPADRRIAHHPVMGPVAWDVGHMTQQTDLWLVQTLGGRNETKKGAGDTYHAYRNPRPTRAGLPLLDEAALRAYWDEVCAGATQVLAKGPRDAADPLWRDGYVPAMVVQHEAQHQETILQHAAAMPAGRYVPKIRKERPAGSLAPPPDPFVFVPAGSFPMGVPPHSAWTYDNEWPVHHVETPAFWLASAPVTNRQFLTFVEAGGYDDEGLWHPDGWAGRETEGWTAPMYWEERADGWCRRAFDRVAPLALDEPVVHVSWFEADAFARWAGTRLPTEAEWEKAATWDAATRTKRAWPWGDAPWTAERANLDHHRFAPDPVGSHPAGATPTGIHHLVGDVWEWLADDFTPYPGYFAFPYEEYSRPFFGPAHKVLRGGAWATRPLLRLATFRNWDLPIRRQVFAGLRLALDAPFGPSRPPRTRLP